MTPSLMSIMVRTASFRARVGEKKYKEWVDKVHAEGNGTVYDCLKEVSDAVVKYNKKNKKKEKNEKA